MRGISEERLQQIANQTHDSDDTNHIVLSFLDYLLSECTELNPWLPIDEFLKSGYTGWCWIIEHGDKSASLARYNNDDMFIGTSGFIVFDEHKITHVMTVRKPDAPKE